MNGVDGRVSGYLRVTDPTEPGCVMAWPNPSDPHEIGWKLRYGTLSRPEMMTAAAVIDAYQSLVSMPQRLRNRRIEQIRVASRSADHTAGNDR